MTSDADVHDTAEARLLLAGATGLVRINLDAIASNWRALADRVTPARCGAVVKADAYGLGAARVIPTLADAGCTDFFIATPGEAETARALLPTADLYALDGLAGDSGDTFARLGVTPVLSTLDDVTRWAALARSRSMKFPAALHIGGGEGKDADIGSWQ